MPRDARDRRAARGRLRRARDPSAPGRPSPTRPGSTSCASCSPTSGGRGRRDRARLLPRLRAARPPARALRAPARARRRARASRSSSTPARPPTRHAAALKAFDGHRRPALLLVARAAAGRARARLVRLVRRQRDLPQGGASCASAARAVPRDRILAETDSPYLAPQPGRGRPNEPANVVHTARRPRRGAGRRPGRARARIDANATRRLRPPVSRPAAKKELGQHFLVDENILGVDRPARRARPRRRRARGRAGPRRPHRPTSPNVSPTSTPSSSTARSSRTCARRSAAAKTSSSVFGDALRLDLAALDPPPAKLVANLPYNIATPLIVGEPRRPAERRALVRDGAARGRRPLLRGALDEGLRRGLRARPAGRRAHRLPSGLAHGLPPAAERGLRARRLPAARAAARVRAPEAARRPPPSPTGARRLPNSLELAGFATRSAAAEALRDARPRAGRPRRGARPAGVRRPRGALPREPRARDREAQPRAPRRARSARTAGTRSSPSCSGSTWPTASRSSRRPSSGSRASPRTRSSARRSSGSPRPPTVEPRWRARIWKHIPVAAGLGGGSSDAATALRLANETARRAAPAERLHELAAGSAPTSPSSSPRARSSATGTGTELAAARAAAGLLGRRCCSPRRAQALDGRRLRRLRPPRRRRGVRGTARAPARGARPRPSARATSQRCRRTTSPPSPHARPAARARRLPRRRERRRTGGLRALPAPRRRPAAAERELEALGRTWITVPTWYG